MTIWAVYAVDDRTGRREQVGALCADAAARDARIAEAKARLPEDAVWVLGDHDMIWTCAQYTAAVVAEPHELG